MSKWKNVSETLPPFGVAIVARWGDGRTLPAVFRDAGSFSIWEVEADNPPLEPPDAWRFEKAARSLMAGELKRSFLLLLGGLLGGGLIALFSLPAGALIAAFAVGIWLYFGAVNAGAEAVAASIGGLGGKIIGLFIATTLMLIPVAAVLFATFKAWEAYQ